MLLDVEECIYDALQDKTVWCGPHWLAGTVKLSPGRVLQILADLYQAQAVKQAKVFHRGYSHAARVAGTTVAWTPHRSDVFVVFDGAECERLGSSALIEVTEALALLPTSRLDLAFDTLAFHPMMAAIAYHNGNVVTQIRHNGFYPMNGIRKGLHVHLTDGLKVTFGSRQSNRFLRTYMKDIWTRVELEIKAERSVEMWKSLLSHDPSEWSRVTLEEFRSFIDFRDLTAASKPKNCPLFDWWATFCQGASKNGVVVPRKKSTLEAGLDSTKSWMLTQFAASFALVEAVDPSFPELLLAQGRERIRKNPAKQALLEKFLEQAREE